MNKITKYFMITDGTSLSVIPIKTTKEGVEALNKMYDAIDKVNIDANYALCDNMKQVNKLTRKWGFSI